MVLVFVLIPNAFGKVRYLQFFGCAVMKGSSSFKVSLFSVSVILQKFHFVVLV